MDARPGTRTCYPCHPLSEVVVVVVVGSDYAAVGMALVAQVSMDGPVSHQGTGIPHYLLRRSDHCSPSPGLFL